MKGYYRGTRRRMRDGYGSCPHAKVLPPHRCGRKQLEAELATWNGFSETIA